MIRTLDTIIEAILSTKHPFRGVVDRSGKPLKSRYERRKVKQCLHIGQWDPEPQT